jgi:hypothetical protein
MFEKLFAPKPRLTPQEFASKLLSICYDADMNGDFYNLLRLTEPQRKRYIFSTFLFTATLPSSMAVASGKRNLLPFTASAYGHMLNVWKDKDSFVRLGDWVITNGEYIRLPEILEKMFQQRVSIKDIENHKIQLGTLLQAVGFIRHDQQIEDTIEIVKCYPPAEELENLRMKYGTQLQSYICEDMFCPERSREELLSRAMIFASLAGTYCKRISEVYFTAIP